MLKKHAREPNWEFRFLPPTSLRGKRSIIFSERIIFPSEDKSSINFSEGIIFRSADKSSINFSDGIIFQSEDNKDSINFSEGIIFQSEDKKSINFSDRIIFQSEGRVTHVCSTSLLSSWQGTTKARKQTKYGIRVCQPLSTHVRNKTN